MACLVGCWSTNCCVPFTAGLGDGRKGAECGLTLSIWKYWVQKREGRGKAWWWSGLKRVVTVTYHLRLAAKGENVLAHIPMPQPFPGNGPKEPEVGDCPPREENCIHQKPRKNSVSFVSNSDFRSKAPACSCSLRPEIPLIGAWAKTNKCKCLEVVILY